MIQPKLEYASGQSWDDRHSVWNVRWVANELIQQNFPPKVWGEFRDMLEEELEGYDSFDSIYVFGYMRYFSFNLQIEDRLDDALGSAKWGREDGFCSPEFVIDPYERMIYLDDFDEDAKPVHLDESLVQ